MSENGKSASEGAEHAQQASAVLTVRGRAAVYVHLEGAEDMFKREHLECTLHSEEPDEADMICSVVCRIAILVYLHRKEVLVGVYVHCKNVGTANFVDICRLRVSALSMLCCPYTANLVSCSVRTLQVGGMSAIVLTSQHMDVGIQVPKHPTRVYVHRRVQCSKGRAADVVYVHPKFHDSVQCTSAELCMQSVYVSVTLVSFAFCSPLLLVSFSSTFCVCRDI